MQRFLCVAFATATLAAGSVAAAPFTCPRTGGDLVFGQEANINSLDQMASNTISTRNIAMNMFESLMTRDENNNAIPELAQSFEESADKLTYTFKLRQGVKFHNGKEMTSADVVASFDRYARVGLFRSMFDQVEGWSAPDANTFVVRMKTPQPTFIELLSSFSVPVVIIPAELKDDPPQRLRTIGTGPFQLVEFVPGSHVRMKRFDGYKPNTNFEQRTGFGGYKVACLDTVTFRVVTEASARVAGLETGELHAVEDIPTKAAASMRNNSAITLLPLQNWWIQIALPNTAIAPTSDLNFRKAVQAALGMEDIMDAATDGNFRLNVGFQYPNQASFSDAGKETYNINDPAVAKRYLAQSGYKGETVILLTNRDYPPMYNSALVMQQQLQAVGIKAELRVVDWPTSVQMSQKVNSTEFHFFFTGWGTQPALGALPTMQFFVSPGAQYRPRDDKDDPEVLALFREMNSLPTEAERNAAFARMQKLVLDKAYAFPFGSLTKIQASRASVKGFVPFRIPRMANVWLEN